MYVRAPSGSKTTDTCPTDPYTQKDVRKGSAAWQPAAATQWCFERRSPAYNGEAAGKLPTGSAKGAAQSPGEPAGELPTAGPTKASAQSPSRELRYQPAGEAATEGDATTDRGRPRANAPRGLHLPCAHLIPFLL